MWGDHRALSVQGWGCLTCWEMALPVHDTSIYRMIRIAQYSILSMPNTWQEIVCTTSKVIGISQPRNSNPWPIIHKASTLLFSHWRRRYSGSHSGSHSESHSGSHSGYHRSVSLPISWPGISPAACNHTTLSSKTAFLIANNGLSTLISQTDAFSWSHSMALMKILLRFPAPLMPPYSPPFPSHPSKITKKK